ncbi:MAG: hypothetical protein U0W40_04985 [Acidimicrobiia bacterium]
MRSTNPTTQRAGRLVAEAARPIDDHRGRADYRGTRSACWPNAR